MTRLWAQDQDDAAVVSALMQDACVRPDEIAYDRAHRRFVILASRFCWEEKDAQRVRAALRIESVTGAQRRNWPEGSERSEEHTSELQSLMRISYAVFCLKKKQ